MVRGIAAFALMAAATCSAAGTRASMRVINQGAYGAAATGSGHPQPTVDLATDEARYRSLWARIVGGSPAPAIDFQEESIVFLSAGQRTTGGYDIAQPEISMKGRTAFILAGLVTPSARGGRRPMVTMAISAPFAVIAIHRAKVQAARWVDGNGATIAESKEPR